MLSISTSDAQGALRSDVAMVALVDQVVRLSGRLAIARKMTTRVAGLRPAHWLILTAICRARTPVTVARIARSFGHSRQGVQRIANTLEAQGVIRFDDNPRDRRAKVLAVTEKGRRMFELADREGQDWAARLSAGMSPESLYAAARVLADFRQRLEVESRKADRAPDGGRGGDRKDLADAPRRAAAGQRASSLTGVSIST